MTDVRPFRPLTLAQSGTLVLLLVLLFLFARGPFLVYGGLSFALLAGYHLLTDHRYGAEQIRSLGLLIPHIAIYLLICTIVIWATTGDEESPYWVIYTLPIAVAASSLPLSGTLATCAAASILFLSQVPSAMYLDPAERAKEIPELAMFCLTFFIVGALIQTFSDQIRRQLQDQKSLNQKLMTNQQALQDSLHRLDAAEESLRRKERLAALGEMSAGLAHEIRNPLGIVSSSAQLLEKKTAGSSPEALQLLSIIQEETTRLNGLVGDFLTFGRPARPERRPADLKTVVLRALDHVQGVAEQQGVAVEAMDLPSLDASVDVDMLRQVLLNLLLNALDATPAGGRIEVRLYRQDAGACIEVSDTGRGIPAAVRASVFDPFVTTKAQGTGLGLANAYRIVESHGGELSLVETSERGTVFRVLLPLEDS